MNKKAIVISGANGNLGSYFARKKLEQTDLNLILLIHQTGNRIKNLLNRYQDRIEIIKTDISDFSSLKSSLLPILDNYFIDSFLHTASKRSSDFMILEKTDPLHWQDIISTNIIGTYNILKILLAKFKKQNHGKIVLMGSNVSRIGLPKGSAYSASKAALANLARTIAIEEAKNGILINVVSPGPIEIDDSHFPDEYRKFRKKYYAKMLSQTPLKRLATLEDIYGAIDFLLSDKNSYITGEEIFITGGKL